MIREDRTSLYKSSSNQKTESGVHQPDMVDTASKTPQEKSKGGRLSGTQILIVDDSSDNRLLITQFLKREGAKVFEAPNGQEGVSLALQNQFDAVLMDIQMPVLDGHTAVRKLREAGYDRPVLALTAHAMKEEMDKALISGFNGYLTKPLDSKSLIEKIEICCHL